MSHRITLLLRRSSLALALLVCLGNAAQGEEALRKVVEIDGGTAKVVQIAVSELQRVAPRQELKGYVVFVHESDSAYVVVFDDPERTPSQRGSTPEMPTFEVEIEKSDLRVVRQNFVR